MLNFMRDSFDEWLCQLAQSYGAEFRDSCRYQEFDEINDGLVITLGTDRGAEKIKTKYVIDATGLRPAIRQKLRNGENQVMLP